MVNVNTVLSSTDTNENHPDINVDIVFNESLAGVAPSSISMSINDMVEPYYRKKFAIEETLDVLKAAFEMMVDKDRSKDTSLLNVCLDSFIHSNPEAITDLLQIMHSYCEGSQKYIEAAISNVYNSAVGYTIADDDSDDTTDDTQVLLSDDDKEDDGSDPVIPHMDTPEKDFAELDKKEN